MAKKKAPPKRAIPSAPPRYVVERLAEAEQLVKEKQLVQACDLAEGLRRRYPSRVEVLTFLVNVYAGLEDHVGYLSACEQLARVDPNNADAALGLADGYLMNRYHVLALRACRHFLRRWPDHPRAAQAREVVAELERELPELLADIGMPNDESGLQFAIQHEEMQVHSAQNRFPQALRTAEALLKINPRFAPALNNLSMIHWFEGRVDQALAAAQRVLEFDPANVHALANATRLMCVNGQRDEAQAIAERLKASTAPAWDRWLKKADGLSFAGDDQGVLDVFRQAEQVPDETTLAYSKAFLAHMAAVAALRLGREAEARRYWKQALKHLPDFDLARENLADLDRPVGERNAPWPFPLTHWLNPPALKALSQFVLRAVSLGSKGGAASADYRRLSRKRPEIARVIPLLLERGDSRTRESAILLADLVRTPELLAALQDFALGQYGPDSLRYKAARIVNDADLFPPGPVRLWTNGEWRDILLLDFEVREAEAKHAPQVQQWAGEAVSALDEGDWARAEQLLDRALAVEPDAPDLLNNRAAAYELQGRVEESDVLLRQIHERYPDYFFARTGLAQRHIMRGEFQEAHEMLQPLLHVKRLSHGAFDRLCSTLIQLFLAEGNRDAARSWLDLWEQTEPDDPQLAGFRKALGVKTRRG